MFDTVPAVSFTPHSFDPAYTFSVYVPISKSPIVIDVLVWNIKVSF
jgi:hypothetical protein